MSTEPSLTRFIFCPEFKDASSNYTTSMRILGFVSTPINLITLLIILFLTPRQMGLFRWYLSFYHLCCTSLDLLLTLGTVPVLFLPLPMGYPFGLLSYLLDISTHHLFLAVVILLFFVFISILVLVFYRFQVILPPSHQTKLTKLGVFLVVSMFYFVLGGAIIFSGIAFNTEQYPIRAYFIDTYSCARNILRYPRVEIYTVESLKTLLIASAVVLTILVSLIFTCLYMTARILKTNCVHISASMLKSHKKFIGLLYVQLILPLWHFILPSIIIVIIIVKSIFYVSLLSYVCVFIFSCHGLLSSLATLYFGEYLLLLKKKVSELPEERRSVLL